ncbi:MAG: ABC transporter permease [Actinomycetota bacterium]
MANRSFVVAVTLVFAAPFLYLVIHNLSEVHLLIERLIDRRALRSAGNSLMLGAAVATAATVVGTGAAWFIARTDVPGKRLLGVLLPLPLVIPSFIGAFVLLAAFAPGGLLDAMLSPVGVERLPQVKGFLGSFLVLTLFTYPYVYLPAAVRLRQLPSSLEESAKLLGSGTARTFRTIVLPQARGAILAGSLLVFLYTISDFGVVQLMRYDALTRAIYATRVFDRGTSLALGLQLATLALLVVAIERSVTSGPRRRDPARGHRPLAVSLNRWRPVASGGLWVLIGVALLVPMSVLAWWTVRGFLGAPAGAGSLVSDPGSLLSPLIKTTAVSVSAAALAVIVLLPVAYLTARHRTRTGAAVNAIVVAGFALPGLAIALSLVYLTVGAPSIVAAFYQSLPLMIVAYVIHFGAHALRASQAALAAVPVRLDDAAKVLGVSRVQRFFRVELPLVTPGLLAGGGLVLLSSMKELPATLLLAPAGFQTLAMKIWQATESAFFADASLASLVLIVLSGVLTWLLVIRRTEAYM